MGAGKMLEDDEVESYHVTRLDYDVESSNHSQNWIRSDIEGTIVEVQEMFEPRRLRINNSLWVFCSIDMGISTSLICFVYFFYKYHFCYSQWLSTLELPLLLIIFYGYFVKHLNTIFTLLLH
jgi:hypothetical protein